MIKNLKFPEIEIIVLNWKKNIERYIVKVKRNNLENGKKKRLAITECVIFKYTGYVGNI